VRAGFHNRFGHFPPREFAAAGGAHARRRGLDPKLVISRGQVVYLEPKENRLS